MSRKLGSYKKMTPEGVAEAVRMYQQGVGTVPIAKHFGVTKNAIWMLLRTRVVMRSSAKIGPRGGRLASGNTQATLNRAVRSGKLAPRFP